MPIVPRIDAPQVGAAPAPGQRFDAPQGQNYAARQTAQLGQAVEEAGGMAARIATDTQEQANQLRVIDALNQVKEAQLHLTHDKDVGYSNLKGKYALERPDGKPLNAEYGDMLKKRIDELGAGLGNDAQKAAFERQASGVLTGFVGQLKAHESQELKTYALSTSEGVQATARRDIALNWNNPDAIDAASSRIRAEAYRQGQLLGKSAEWQEAAARKLTSDGHKIAMLTALENGNPAYAETYMAKYASQMEPEDIMAVGKQIRDQRNVQVGTEKGEAAVRQVVPQMAPSDADRAFNILLGTESGGKQFAPNGQPLTSPKGAIGVAQVMPGTAPEAAKLAGLPWDEHRYRTDPEYNKALGRAYFTKQLQDFGSIDLAWAAYNAGPGAVRKALKIADKPVMVDANADPSAPKRIGWLSLLPKETQQYVAKNMAAYESGGGAPQRPTLADIDARLQADPDLAGSPTRMKIAREAAARQFKVQEDAIKQRGEDATAEAMRQIVGNGGHFADLPASVRGAIPPKEVDNVLNFAGRVAKGEDVTSPMLYARLSSDPGQLARMSDAQFFMLRRELSESDFKHFANERAKQMGGVTGANGPGDLNSAAIKQTLDARMRVLGMDPTPKDDGGADAARVGAVRQFVDQYFFAAQREAGKKFTDAEVAHHVDALFSKNATLRGWFSDSSGPMLGMKSGDIPTADRDALKAAFKRRGVDAPTDAQLLNAYWTLKVSRK